MSAQPMPTQQTSDHPGYTGPPSYHIPPRWGFPQLSFSQRGLLPQWGRRWPVPVATPADEQMRALAAVAVPLLGLTAMLVLATAGAEAWRYELLLDSRTDAVPAGPLHASDALVVTGGVVSLLSSVLAGAVTLGWLVHANAAAARAAAITPARPAWQLIAGVLMPGVNLVVPGAVLAELEHAALGQDPSRRPRPSRLVIGWWVIWVTGLVLTGTAILWNLRDGTQARADGVLLHVATDLVAGAVAIATIMVVRRLTRLLSPVKLTGARRMVVVRVPGGSPPSG
ncbi:MAG: DUF4328 domain-containing protein [Actinomycetota bacterium]|nr:DUF4328 domain-containing protein [Actinomycetota bacterium]